MILSLIKNGGGVECLHEFNQFDHVETVVKTNRRETNMYYTFLGDDSRGKLKTTQKNESVLHKRARN